MLWKGRVAMGKSSTTAAVLLAGVVPVLVATAPPVLAAGPAGHPDTPRVCAHPPRPANPDATADAVAVHTYLWRLTCGSPRFADGVVSGQNVGHGSQATDPDGWFGYPRLVAELARDTGRYVGVVGVDYEHDQVFTPAQLSVANDVLVGHERRGGLVAVTWSPLSPWLNDERDIEADPGTWTDTRTDAGQLDGVELADLFDPATPAGEAWRRKLARVADALAELRDAGVTVLWRPMQEMNGWWFWWGTTLQPDEPSVYVRLWRDMYRYLTQERRLDNLLWVYSPASRPVDPAERETTRVKPAAWAYPGADVVDVVAGTSYQDDLLIPDYPEYLRLPEVVGEAEYSAGLRGEHDRDGDLDTTRYADRLREDYPAVAYWVSWHDFPWSDTENAWLSLASNRRAGELLADPYVITADELPR
ncbi:glycoside hydrolase family 26 protein [Plantactinospora sp. CA-290183]|uniref:glycoside hydrolase family 26 protein n=1 Tax=Plantactinospora sp. CA-290183 TaxID=3240006 RepID=UPI003D92C7D1